MPPAFSASNLNLHRHFTSHSNKIKWLGIYLVLTAVSFSRFSCSQVTSGDLGLERVWVKPIMSACESPGLYIAIHLHKGWLG